jgi:hypothetical protein
VVRVGAPTGIPTCLADCVPGGAGWGPAIPGSSTPLAPGEKGLMPGVDWGLLGGRAPAPRGLSAAACPALRSPGRSTRPAGWAASRRSSATSPRDRGQALRLERGAFGALARVGLDVEQVFGAVHLQPARRAERHATDEGGQRHRRLGHAAAVVRCCQTIPCTARPPACAYPPERDGRCWMRRGAAAGQARGAHRRAFETAAQVRDAQDLDGARTAGARNTRGTP